MLTGIFRDVCHLSLTDLIPQARGGSVSMQTSKQWREIALHADAHLEDSERTEAGVR
jgi:hypothetical protein